MGTCATSSPFLRTVFASRAGRARITIGTSRTTSSIDCHGCKKDDGGEPKERKLKSIGDADHADFLIGLCLELLNSGTPLLLIDGSKMQEWNRSKVQVRLRPCKFGDVVTVKNCKMHFYLPDGLPDRSKAVVVGHTGGRIIVEAFGRTWNVAMQCVDNGADYFCNDQWLDQHDRRCKKLLRGKLTNDA
jgi:hypothetical protein